MSTIEIKEKILDYIEYADDNVLEAIYTLLRANMDEHSLSDEQMAEVERRRADHLSGKSKTYSWEEAKKMIGKK
jgi:putative addiction module component (TIGR02574 family)